MSDVFKPETIAVQGGYDPAENESHTTTVPIYQSNAYDFGSVETAAGRFDLSESGNIYTRITNPTVACLENRVNELEGGVGAVAFSSGHAAIFSSILNIACAGDEIVSSRQIYGGAINLLDHTLKNIGIETKFVDVDDLAAWEEAITPKTRAFFIEIVGNPNANVADVEKIAEIAHRHNIPLIADSTFTTPALIRPFEYGVDIVIHSATKFLGGQGNSMAGIVVDSGNFQWLDNERFPLFNAPDPSYHGIVFAKDVGDAGFAARLRTQLLRDVGSCLSPFNAFLILNGIETLFLRMPRHCENALTTAEFLEKHPLVEKVHYPFLPSDEYYPLAKKYLPKGAGSVFTFELKGGRDAGIKFLNSLKLFRIVANVGDTKSLAIHPASTTHSQLSDQQLIDGGITSGTVRLSVGIENIEDILADLQQALEASDK